MSLSHIRDRGLRRRAKRLLLGAYTAFLTGGTLALVIAPRTIEGALGLPVHWLWTVMVLLGGLIGAWSIHRDRWRPERWITYLIGPGLLIYAGTLSYLAWASDSWGRIGLSLLTFGAALFVFYRGVEVEDRARADRETHDALEEG